MKIRLNVAVDARKRNSNRLMTKKDLMNIGFAASSLFNVAVMLQPTQRRTFALKIIKDFFSYGISGGVGSTDGYSKLLSGR